MQIAQCALVALLLTGTCAVFCVHAHNSAAFVAAHRVAHVNELGQQSRKCLHKCLFCATGMDKQDKVILLTACVPMLEGF